MINIKHETFLLAYGEDAQNINISEDTEYTPPREGMRRFLVHPMNTSPDMSTFAIELSSNQEAARVTKISSGEDRIFMCANNHSAEELFGQTILPLAESYMKD